MKNRSDDMRKLLNEFKNGLPKDDSPILDDNGIIKDNSEDYPIRTQNNEKQTDTYNLTNGKTLTLNYEDSTGPVGESMTIISFIVDGENVPYDDVRDLLSLKDKKEVDEIIGNDNEDNYNSAMDWII